MSRVAWRRERRLWLPALVLLVIAICAFSAYRLLWAGGAQARGRQVQRARIEHERLVAQREHAEMLVRQADRAQTRLERMYGRRFKTERQRITKVIAEVKELAGRAGLDPPTIHYPDEPISSYGLVKRSIVFGVDGTYAALRRFVNFLELTDSFVTLEEIRPSENSSDRGERLSINLRVSTLFLEDGVEPADLARSREAARAVR